MVQELFRDSRCTPGQAGTHWRRLRAAGILLGFASLGELDLFFCDGRVLDESKFPNASILLVCVNNGGFTLVCPCP